MTDGTIIEMRMTLQNIEPAVWRSIQVPGSHTFEQLGVDLVDAMGWEGSRQWGLGIDDVDASGIDPDAQISSILTEGSTLNLIYDLDDLWTHLVRVSGILEAEPGELYPRCTDGAQACPIEDIGGDEWYQDLIDTIYDSWEYEAPDERADCFDEENIMFMDWDPDEFDPEAVEFSLVELPEEELLLERYIVSAVNLYGVISPERIIEIYNAHHRNDPLIPIDTQAMRTGDIRIHLGRLEKQHVDWYDGYFIHESVFTDDEVRTIRHNQAAKPWYVSQEQELLKFIEYDHLIESPSYERFKRFLSKQRLPVGESAEQIAYDVVLGCNDINDDRGYIKEFLESGIDFTEYSLHAGMQLLQEVANNTRRWVNNGYTPNELFEMNERPLLDPLPAEPFVTGSRKVGRNDPCPCGSGKKYKHCCMNRK